MRRNVLCGVVIGILGVAELVAGQATGPGAQALSTMSSDDAARVARMVRDLGATDYGVRDGAQKELQSLPLAMHDALVRLTEEARDPEVQARLRARVSEMEDQSAIDPPRLSLDVEKGTLEDVAKTLEKAGVHIRAEGATLNGRYTLHLQNKTLWEILDEVNRQEGVAIRPRAELVVEGIQARMKGDPVLPSQSVYGVRAELRCVVDTGSMVVHLETIFDPRITVLARGSPVYTQIVDDKGRDLLAGATMARNFHDVTDSSLKMIKPADPGAHIALLKGHIPLILGLEWKEVVVEMGPDDGKEMTLGLAKFTLPDPSNGIVGRIVRPDPTVLPQLAGTESTGVLRVRLVDSAGKKTRGVIAGYTFAEWTPTDDMHGPYKWELAGVTKFRLVDVPLEFKDVPIVQAGAGR